MKKQLRRIKIRRGTEDQRKLVIFEEGEPVYIRDTKRVYVGDSETKGGIIVSNKNHVTTGSTKPPEAIAGDIIHFETTGDTLIVDRNGDLLPILINMDACCISIQSDINIIDDILKRLRNECCDPALRLITDDGIDILLDNKDWIRW